MHKGTAEHVDAAHKQDAAALAEDGSQAGQSSASTTDRTASGGNVGLQGGSASGRSGAGSTVASSVRGGAASGSGTAAAGGGGSTSGTSSGAATTTTSDDTTQGSSTTLQALQQQGQAGRTGAAATGQQGEAANQQRRQLLQTGTDAAAQDAAVVTSTAASGDAKGSSTAGGTVAAEGAAAAEGSSSGGVALGSQATLAELNHAGSQADDLTRALEMLGLKSNMGSTVMAVAGAPIARWVFRSWGLRLHWSGRSLANLQRIELCGCVSSLFWLSCHAPGTPADLGLVAMCHRQVPSRRDAGCRDVHQPQYPRRGGRVQGGGAPAGYPLLSRCLGLELNSYRIQTMIGQTSRS